MPSCPHCGKRVEGDYITAQAATDIISQRDLLKSQKESLENRNDRQAAWIERLEKNAKQMKHEIRFLRDELEKVTGRTWFDKAGRNP